MTRQEVFDLFARRRDAINARDVAGLGALYAVDCRVESPFAAGAVQGRQAIAKIHQRLFDAIPDLTLTAGQVIIDGDQGVQIATMSGTYTGESLGLPPSGKPLKLPVVVHCRIEDGLIAEERRIYDFTGMLVQIGVLKTRSA